MEENGASLWQEIDRHWVTTQKNSLLPGWWTVWLVVSSEACMVNRAMLPSFSLFHWTISMLYRLAHTNTQTPVEVLQMLCYHMGHDNKWGVVTVTEYLFCFLGLPSAGSQPKEIAQGSKCLHDISSVKSPVRRFTKCQKQANLVISMQCCCLSAFSVKVGWIGRPKYLWYCNIWLKAISRWSSFGGQKAILVVSVSFL